jgi:HEAT repeat protein
MSADLQSLIHQLLSVKSSEQLAAAEALARLGEDAQPASVALVSTLRTSDPATREWLATALETLGPPASTQIGELTKLAGDPSLDAAYWAITLLGRAGSDAASAVGALVNILRDSEESALRERAAWALGNIGPAAASAVPSLREAAAGSEPRLARLAHQALGEIEL